MSASDPGWFRRRADGVDIVVRLTPKGGADRIEGVDWAADGAAHLKARVRAAPEKGAANAALEKLLAEWLDVPKSRVSVASGATARLKTVHVAGDFAEVAAKLAGAGEAPARRYLHQP